MSATGNEISGGRESKGFKMVVGGFLFTDERTAQKARQEEESIQYVKDRLDMENPRKVLEIYHKLIAERMFETPVGLLYLKELQNYLITRPEIAEEGSVRMAAIPFAGAAVQTGGAGTGGARAGGSQELEDQEALELYAEKLEESRQKERTAEYRMRRAEERAKASRGHLRISLFFSLFFLLVAIGFGVITMTDNHPNILNYENKIIEKYQNWEEELQNREQAIKEQESEMNSR